LSPAAYCQSSADETLRDQGLIISLDETEVIELRWGFCKRFESLRQQGKPWNHKRVHRGYCQMGLNQAKRVER
jgi:putative transposase